MGCGCGGSIRSQDATSQLRSAGRAALDQQARPVRRAWLPGEPGYRGPLRPEPTSSQQQAAASAE
jgi:hypothetical protein